jgi:hypothetical protein
LLLWERLQLRRVPTGRILEALEYFRGALKFMRRPFALLCCSIFGSTLIAPQTDVSKSAIRSGYSVIEFRHYTIEEGEREHFARRFESFFPGTIQQTGAIIAGESLGEPIDIHLDSLVSRHG